MTGAADASWGCPQCWPPSSEDAWAARRGLVHTDALIDESHFGVDLLVCPACTQRFLFVFTETIDWVDGDDPQCWVRLPITSTEATALLQKGSAVSEADIDGLGGERRSLTKDAPKGAPAQVFWSWGLFIGLHD